ncbi:MAG: N-acetyltransferase, partial [Verrucomicrobia bacterium]|nr:N-acetyltransferase [Cytophagales bacterium]
MKEAAKHDKSIVLKILMESFDDNPSVNYVIKQDEKRKRRIKELMSYSFEYCLLFGKVFLSENEDGCVMLLYPTLKKTTFSTLLLDIKFVFH